MKHFVKLENIKLIGNCIGFLSTFPINQSKIFTADNQKVEKEITYSRILDVCKLGDSLTLDIKEGDTVIVRKNCIDTKDAIVVEDMCTDTSMSILISIPHYDIVSILNKDKV